MNGARSADRSRGWRTFGEHTVYDSRWVRLGLVDVAAPDGRRWDYHVVRLPPIAIAVLHDEATDRVLMAHRYRFATDESGYELLGFGRGGRDACGRRGPRGC